MTDAKTDKDARIAIIDRILSDIQRKIRPDMKIVLRVEKIVKEINDVLKSKSFFAECVIGGSLAKGTFLKDDHDADLFIRYDQAYKDKDISSITEEIIASASKKLKIRDLQRVHGSRDYFQFRIKMEKKFLDFEVIPVMLVHAADYKNAQNITDLSPEHVFWVRKNTDKNPQLVDDIRLAKQFCKANNIYGAESYINGFSGHILDILVIYYGSFLNLLGAFSKIKYANIKNPIIIDPERRGKNLLKDMNKSKIAPLVIIDPIQKDRNSAAALSCEKLIIFADSARAFLEKPDKKYFEIKKYDMKKELRSASKNLKKKDAKEGAEIITIALDTLDGSKDVVGTKILKAYEAMNDHLKLNDFKVLGSGWNFMFEKKKAEMYFIISKDISKNIEQEGPPISAKTNYQKFVDKHSGLGHKTFIRGNRIYAVMPRKYTDPKKFLKKITREEFISRRFKKITIR